MKRRFTYWNNLPREPEEKRLKQPHFNAYLCLLACLATLIGCGGPARTVVHGTVSCSGEKAQTGQIRFVPIEDTPGGVFVAKIVDGEYRADNRGGLTAGKYRVEVDARKKTGRKVLGNIGTEHAMVEETVRLGRPEYAGRKSPLVLDTASAADGRFDIDVSKNRIP